MQEISNFIVNNWQWLLTVAAGVVEFILLVIFRRDKKIVNLPDDLYAELVVLIKEAEELFGSGHGKEKKKYVEDKYSSMHPAPNGIFNLFATVVGPFIEDILSTPQKKGGK